MTTRIPLDAIVIGSSRRKTEIAKVRALAESIAAIGLRTPITVLAADSDGKHRLVVGRNRLEAHRLLGVADIEAQIETDKLSAELWEIAENLHRSELTAIQRAMLVGRWVKLWARKTKQGEKPVQLAQVSVGGRGHQGGISAAARSLGLTRRTAQRAVNISEHLTKPALREAERLGLLNNQRVLSDAAGSQGADEQVACLQRAAERIRKRKRERTQMKAAIAEMKSPRSARDAFREWLDSLDVEFRMQVRIWLLSEEAETWLEELGEAEERRRAGRLN